MKKYRALVNKGFTYEWSNATSKPSLNGWDFICFELGRFLFNTGRLDLGEGDHFAIAGLSFEVRENVYVLIVQGGTVGFLRTC
jgi:hypothetical protein